MLFAACLDVALNAFANATVFNCLDIAMAHHQVSVKASDVKNISFITHMGLFEMKKMLFGSCNAPSTYQHLMVGVQQKLNGRIYLAYLDNVTVFSKNAQNKLLSFKQCSTIFALLAYNYNNQSACCLSIRSCTSVTSFRQPAYSPIPQSCAYLLNC